MNRNIFFSITHLSTIIFFSIYLCIKGYMTVTQRTNKEIPLMSSIASVCYKSRLFNAYRILSGTNTGYGFYGTSVATQKFVSIEVYDKACKLILKDDAFNFNTFVGKSRFDGFPTHISNFMEETKRMKRDENANKKLVALREKYVEKVFKHLGKSVCNKTLNSYCFKISLITILPISIWNEKKISKNVVYVEKIYQYDVI
jgi:hypothetical protein